jgi:hypothetical protein
MRGGVLLVKMLSGNPLRITFQGQWPVTQMGQNGIRNFGIERDDLTLSETVPREIDLLQIRDRQLSTVYFDLFLPGYSLEQ